MTDLTSYPDSRERVIDFLATYLEDITEKNDAHRPGTRLKERESVFDMTIKPRNAARAFVTRLPHHLPDCGARSFVVAFIYLSRFLRRHRRYITLDSFNVRRLLLTSLLTATKFELGFGYNNSLFARIGWIKLNDVNNMEIAFLNGIDFYRTVEGYDFDNFWMLLYYHELAPIRNLEIALPILSASPATLVLPCCLYVGAACNCSEQTLLE